MTAEAITECRLCVGRVCTVMQNGRLINDNGEKRPVDTSKIKMDKTKIEDCGLRESLETDDERLLLGS